MQATLQDRQDIADLMTGWMHRDLSEWEQLAGLFHPDGTIEITWFEGTAADFIEGSKRMGVSDVSAKHFVAQPVIRFNGDKAIVETNAAIILDNRRLDLGCVTHNRFYDRIEKRAGAWRIVHRQSIYDTGYFTFPSGIVDIDKETVRRYPREYAALAYLLDKGGFPVKRVFATKGSELEKQMKREGLAWLERSA